MMLLNPGGGMNGKKVRYILSVVISTIIMGLIFFYLFKYFRRHMVIRAQKQITQHIDRELIELQVLGFAPESELIQILRKRKAHLLSAQPTTESHDIEEVLALQKKMLMSYIMEAKLLRKRDVDPKSNLMRFAYDKIVRLTIAVAELERQLNERQDDRSEFQKRVDRMKEITRQSIAHYKKQLREYMQRGLAYDDGRIQEARDMLAVRIKHLYQM
jgi:hypothetical protein